MKQRETLVALAVLFLGCGDPLGFERELDAPIQTDHLSYEMRRVARGYETEIEYTFTNPMLDTVFIPNCNGLSEIVMERWDGSSWQAAWAPNVPDCASPAIEIAPGQSWSTTLSVFGGDANCGCFPQFADGIEGTFRLNWHVVLGSSPNQPPFGDVIPEDQRVSNRFALQRE